MAKNIKLNTKASVVGIEPDDNSSSALLYSSVAALQGTSSSSSSNQPIAPVMVTMSPAAAAPAAAVSGPSSASGLNGAVPSNAAVSSFSPANTPAAPIGSNQEQISNFSVSGTAPLTAVSAASTTDPTSSPTSTSSFSALALASTSPIIYTGSSVTLDESSGLQNAATTSVAGDSNDNDIANSALPTAFSTRLTALGAGTPLEAAESGYNGVTGQNVFTIDPAAVVSTMTLTDASGHTLNGLDSGLSAVDGRHIYLYNDSVNTNIVLGKTTTGEIIFAVYLQEQTTPVRGGQLWTVLYAPLFHPDATNPDDSINLAGKISVTVDGSSMNPLDSATPGQHLFFMVGGTDAGLVVTGYHPANQSTGAKLSSGDTVNVSHAGTGGSSIGTNNQMINSPTFDKAGHVAVPGEGMIFTFVTGPNPEYTGFNLSQAEADVEANIQFAGLKNSDSAFFLVSQLQPTKAATLEITALNTGLETGVNYIDGLIVNDTPVNITRVVVMNTAGKVLEDSNGSVNSPSIGITFSGGSAFVSGVVAGNQIQYYTTGTHNRVLIQNSGSTNADLNASFDIGNFSFVGFTHSSADVGSLIAFEDSAPTVDVNTLVHLDDAALAGGSGGGAGDVSGTTGTLAHNYGTDGAGAISWISTGAPAGFSYVVSGTTLYVKEASTTVLTLTLDTSTGSYTVVQNAPVVHAPGDGKNSQPFAVSYQVTDRDHDPVTGVLNLTVKDDVPSVTSNLLVHLDDAALAGGSGGGSGDVLNTTGTLAHNFAADGAGSIVWQTSGAPDGFTYESSGTSLLIKEAGVTVMTLTLDSATGAYTVVQNAAVLHAPGGGLNSQPFTVAYQVIDKDSDPANGVLNITVKDDIPSVTSNLLVHLDDAALAGGSGGGSGDVLNTTGTLSHTFGADGAGSIQWVASGAPVGFTYEVSDNILLIKEGGVTTMTLTVDPATGAYTVVQNAAVIHPPGGGTNSEAFSVTYQVIDKDNDPVSGALVITVKDDIPSVTSNALVRLDDAALLGGTGGGTGDIANTTGTLAHSYGGDGSGSIGWQTTGAPDGFTYESSGATLLVKEAGVTVMTLTLDPVTGGYSVVQNASVMHIPGDGTNGQAFSINYLVTDKDSDPVSGVLVVNIKDDIPVVTSNPLVHLDDAALPGGTGGGAGDVSNTAGTLAHTYGADGAGTMGWLATGAPAGFAYEVSGNELLVKEAGVTVMTLTLDPASGVYSVVQNAAVMHASDNGANSQAFAVNYVVTDKDSDPVDGVLNITVKDDVPTVTGNALVRLDDAALPGGSGSGDIANVTGTLEHNYGADGSGSMGWLTTDAPTGFSYEKSGTTLLVKEAGVTVMTLTLDAITGAYTVVQNAAVMHATGNGTNAQAFAVNYEVIDKDSDPVDGVLNITIKDDIPSVTSNLLVHLDDAALAGGSGGGSGDVLNTSGTLEHSYGADGAGTMNWLATGAPDGFVYEVSGNSLLVKEADVTVMTLTLDPSTGAYTAVQNAAVMHAPANGANAQAFAVNYEVLDKDGDPVDGVLNITVKDDLPAAGSNSIVHLDDAALPGGTGGGAGDVSNTAGTLAHSYGADGAGTMGWLATGAPVGFAYEVSGNELLVKEAGVTVMTLTLDPASGVYSVVQNAAVMHASDNGANSQAFAVNYVVTDKDSDPVDGVLNITVKDDVPTVTGNALVHLDDAALPGGSGGGTGDVLNTTGTLGHNFAADGGGSIGWLTNDVPAGFTYESSGTTTLLIKEAGVTVLTLTLDNATGDYAVTQNAAIMHAPANGTNSQAFAVNYEVIDKDGDPVDGVLNITVKDDIPSVASNPFVHLDDAALAGGSSEGAGDVSNLTGTLAHSYGADSSGSIGWLSAGAPDGFSYEVSGNVLLVKEGGVTVITATMDTTTGAYSVVQNATVVHATGEGTNSQAFALNYQVTDKDSDPVDGILNITVKDDVPSVTSNALVELDDAAMAGGSGSAIVANTTGTLAHHFGADGAGSIDWLSTGAPDGFTYESSGSTMLVKEAGVTVITLTVDETTGAYTVVQNAALMHASGNGENLQVFDMDYRVIDKDGDPATGLLVLTVKDDIPSVSTNLLVHLDDAALPGGSGGGTGDILNTTGTLSHSYNADGSGSIVWDYSGAPPGFTYQASGSDLLIVQGSTTVVTLTVDSVTGAYTVVQNAAVDHALGSDSQAFAVAYTVTDKDGDPVNGALDITVKDDLPTGSFNPTVLLDDAALAGGSGGSAGSIAHTTGTLDHHYNADSVGHISWLTTGAPAGFEYESSGNDLLVKENGLLVMTLTLTDTAAGAYSIVQNAPLSHAAGQGTNSQDFTVTYLVTDHDGDTDIGPLNISVKDDIPSVSSNVLVHLDDAALAGGSGGGVGDVLNTTGILAHSFGADSAGSIGWLSTGAPAGFSYEVSGNTLEIKEAGVTTMTLTLDATTGAYSVVQNTAVLHAPADGTNSQPFAVSYQIMDKDTDPVNGVLNITVKDDVPSVTSNLLVHLDDAALVGGSGGGTGDVQNTTGTLAHNFAADGAGSLAWLATGAPTGFTYEVSGNTLLIKEAGVTALTLTVDATTGAYSVVQNAAVLHAPADGTNSQAFAVNYQVNDKDSDPVSGVLNITVKDDLPSVTSNLLVHLDDAALAGGSGSGDVLNTTGTLAHSFGADGAGSVGWLTTGAPGGYAYEVSGNTLLIKEAGVTAMTLTVDATTGAYSVVQNTALMHSPADGTNSQPFAVNYQVIDKDSDPVNGVLNITVKDDIPSVTSNLFVHLDDAALSGGNSTGTVDVLNTTGTLAHSYGADGAGSMGWLTTGAPTGFTYESSGNTLLVKEAGTTVVTLTLDSSTGNYSVVQNAAVLHAPGGGINSQGFTIGYQVIDKDSDPVNGVLNVSVQDDMPVVHAISDASYANTGNPTPGGTGVFSYSIGADHRTSYSASSSDFSIFSLLGQVGKNSITNSSALWVSENSSSATFALAFDYQPNENSTFTEHATGTLNFNKTAGTYSIALNAPIDSYSISTTSSAQAFIGYEVDTSVVDRTQPAVSVAQLTTNLFAQFTGISEPGGGTGVNNLQAVAVDGSGSNYVDGELFAQAPSWVSTSNLANGVGGDTLQKGEVLDFNLYSTNPQGYLNTPATVQASSMFLKFDGIGSENLVAVLKLVDSVDGTHTTKALVIDNSDILKAGNTITPNYGINLDSNDGAIVIESNDFNAAGQHYLITGAQLLTSTEDITGTGINFNSAIGAAGASTTTEQMGAATTDNDVIKVSDIGIVTQSTSTLDSNLHIALAVKDADLDATTTQTLNVLIAGSSSTAPIVLDMNGDGVIQYLDRSAGVQYDYAHDGHALSTAWVGPRDGLLAIQQPDQSLNIVFSTKVGETDMQGLAKVYDTNHDNILSSLDAQYQNFGVWQDASSNGKVDSGEFVSLTKAGITSISLDASSTASTAASGEVHVVGQSSFTKSDGSVGHVDDASFSIGLLTAKTTEGTSGAETVSISSTTVKLSDVLQSSVLGAVADASTSNATVTDAKHDVASVAVSSIAPVTTATADVISAVTKDAATTITLADVMQSPATTSSVNTTSSLHDTASSTTISVAYAASLPTIHEELVHATI